MDAADLKKARQLLLTRREELLADVAQSDDGIVILDQSRVGRLSRMDALQGQAMSQAMQQRRELALQQIAAALRRLDSGDYGYCRECDELISAGRLEYDPATPLCLECASKT